MDVEKIVRNAVIDLLGENPFFGHIVCQFPKVYTDAVGTLAVGRQKDGSLINLYVNPRYIEGIFNSSDHHAAYRHMVEVLKHEILHVVFRHPWVKCPDVYARNIACELSVNSYIDRDRLIDRGVFPEDFGWQRELGFDAYYALLHKENSQQQEQPGKGKSGRNKTSGSNGGGSGNDSPGIGDGSSSGDGSEECLDDHGTWSTLDDSEGTEILLKDIVRKAHDIAKSSSSWGDMPASLRREVEGMVESRQSQIPWQVVLREFVLSSSETVLSYTNRRISRRFGTRPGTRKEDTVNLAVGIDVSGSIDYRMLGFFFSELDSICRQGVQATVFEADTEIKREYPYSQLDTSSITGGGGTDLEPIIKEADARRFDVLVYFTDGYAPVIETAYSIPVIFVICGRSLHTTRKELPYPCRLAFLISNDEEAVVAE